MINYVILLLLFMYIASLLAMQLFAGKLKFDDDDNVDPSGTSPRINFDNIGNAHLAVFIVLIGENWNQVMYQAMRGSNDVTAGLFFIIFIAFGQIVMLNLFLAMLLGNFDGAFKTGCFTQLDGKRPINALYTSLLRAAGKNVERFNMNDKLAKKFDSGSGPLRELLV